MGGPSRRFLIRRVWWVQPLLFLVGLTRDSNSYVALEGDQLVMRFGWFYNNAFPLDEIESASAVQWPWYHGLGWRADLHGLAGIVGSYEGVVEVRLKQRHRVSGIIPFVKLACDRIAVSLEEPEAFLAVIRRP